MKLFLAAVLCLACFSANAANPRVGDELDYVKRLRSLGMAEYAAMVLERVKESAGDEYYPMKVEAMVTTRQGIADAEKLVASMNQSEVTTWQVKLVLADGYYAWGDYAQVKKLYGEYLAKFRDEHRGNEKDYKDAAYKFAQMLEMMGDRKAAAEAYDTALAAGLERHEKRQVLANKAELLVRLAQDEQEPAVREELCRQVDEICGGLLWERDLWFGKAIVMKAHVKMLRGDNEGTIALLEEYMPVIREIDNQLRGQSAE
jgi:tetratricopeptide (TPR) repeat protein